MGVRGNWLSDESQSQMKTLPALNPALYGADKLERDMAAIGYVRSPNNIYALPSVHWRDDDPLKGLSPEWYAGQGGLPSVKSGQVVQVCHDRIRIFVPKWFGAVNSKRSYWDTVTVAVFDNAPDFIAWCNECGQLSEPGVNYGYLD
jgi:hypothetical protein